MATVWIESAGVVYRCEPQHLLASGELRVFDVDQRAYVDVPLVGIKVSAEAPAKEQAPKMEVSDNV